MSVIINIEGVATISSEDSGNGMVYFLVGTGNDQETFMGEKKSVALLSPDFAKMVSEATATEDLSQWIILPDDDPDAFRNIMFFVETGSSAPSKTDAVKTLLLARKYNVATVTKECREYIKEKIVSGGADFAVEVLEMAQQLDDDFFKIIADDYLIPRFCLLVNSPLFLKLSYTTVCEYLQNELVAIDSELLVFNACLRWGKNECEKKGLDPDSLPAVEKVLKDIRQLIRYPVIPQMTFLDKVQPLNFLKPEEISLLHEYWELLETNPAAAEMLDLPFRKTRRTGPLSSATFFSRKPSSSPWTSNTDLEYGIRLWSEFSIEVYSLMLYGQLGQERNSGKVRVRLLIKTLPKDSGGRYTFKEAQIGRMVRMSGNNISIEFENPLHITAGDRHELQLCFLDCGTLDNSTGKLFGTGWKSELAETRTLASSGALIKVKKLIEADCLFHTLVYKITRYVTDTTDIAHRTVAFAPSNSQSGLSECVTT